MADEMRDVIGQENGYLQSKNFVHPPWQRPGILFQLHTLLHNDEVATLQVKILADTQMSWQQI